MTGDNLKYGKLVRDAIYIQRVLEDARDKLEDMQYREEYSEDGAKEVILDWLDELGIYPEDIDYVFSELEF